MRYYPIFLDVADRPVVIIGGGSVALRKVEGLLEAGARVTVISPELHPDLAALVDRERLNHLPRSYQLGDLKGYDLAFVATDDRSINAAVAQEGKERHIWVNAADDPANCDFVMPSVIRRGNLTVAISTAGGSPAAARKIREELEDFLTQEYALLLDLATEVRQELREKDITVDSEVWNLALDRTLRELLVQGKGEEAKEQLLRSLLKPEKVSSK